MLPALAQYGLTSFVTLLVVVDPFGLLPLYTTLTAGLGVAERRATLRRAIQIACGVALFFLLAGRVTLGYLGVTVNAFAISGGILLFATALPMLFGHRAGLQGPEPGEGKDDDTDIAVFPLAIPLISGPGTITTVILLTAQARGDLRRLSLLVLDAVLVFALTWLVLRLGESLMAHLGDSGARVLTRVLGLVLAALAVQFVLNGVTGYAHTLR